MTTEPRELMRRLANWEAPEGTGVLSAYLDARPAAPGSGDRPGMRPGSVVLKDRLHQIEKSLLPRGPALDSFRVDRPRIEAELSGDLSGVGGVAIFACSAGNLFEVVRSPAAFRNRVIYGRRPALFQLARMVDEFEPAVVAVADTNTLRLFVVQFGGLEEVGGRDEDSIHFQKRATGGWSQARYQRHIQKHREDFARDAAEAIRDLMEREDATRLVLAGDEVVIPLLQAALPPTLLDRLAGDALRIHIRASKTEVAAEVAEVLAAAEERDSLAVADALVGEVLADDLGVAGIADSREALTQGAGEVLVIADRFEPAEVRNELTRLAVQTGAQVEVVSGHEALDALGGVGVLLRYRAWGS
ncbi:MAG TPA: Vms1/Ankzf1 family peptidyl-tRNA hydrolase [Tepidiformaceae bacterium]|nr:Vms1/Ankzf1 family peptidyl-tRNA hydrolase [Tepidiformaceae bacterium]